MLRVENEAQLAAVLGHEIGHYLRATRWSSCATRSSAAPSACSSACSAWWARSASSASSLAVRLFARARARGRPHRADADAPGRLRRREAARCGRTCSSRSRSGPTARRETRSSPPTRRPRSAWTRSPRSPQADPGGVKQRSGVAQAREALPARVARRRDQARPARGEPRALHAAGRAARRAPEYLVARGETYRLRSAKATRPGHRATIKARCQATGRRRRRIAAWA